MKRVASLETFAAGIAARMYVNGSAFMKPYAYLRGTTVRLFRSERVVKIRDPSPAAESRQSFDDAWPGAVRYWQA